MKTRILELVDEASGLASRGDKHLAALGLLRIALQHLSIGLAEWVVAHGDLAVLPATRSTLIQLRCPSDGTLVDAIVDLMVAAENSNWKGVSLPWWTKMQSDRESLRLGGSTLHDLLVSAVTLRNDGAEGHGIAGGEDPDAVLDLVRMLSEQLSFWPVLRDDGTLYLEAPDGRSVTLQLLRSYGRDVVCYRRIKRIRSSRCRVDAQRQTSLQSRVSVAWEADDILREGEHTANATYDFWTTADPAWTPVVLLPERLTDTFTGREEKLAELRDWFNDLDSWACMVFGDGGVGKTTLILEFLHQVLDGSMSDVRWKPELISYFTAKQTVWGFSGLVRLAGGSLTVVDVCRTIVSAWDGKPLSRDWFSIEPSAAVDRLGTFLNELGIARKNHLVILDNTETLATSEDEIRQLRHQIDRLTKRVGRVLLTSRRFEQIQAQSVELPPLTIDEAVELLRLRGAALQLDPLKSAGNSTLRKYAERLGRRPLVLEVFLQTLSSEPGLGLQRAFDRVQRMQHQDLGEFLYQDAWARLSSHTKHLVLLMTRVANVLDEALVKLCCAEVDTSVMAAFDTLRASRGIATLPRIGGETQVVFHPDFLVFCRGRTVTVEGRQHPTDAAVSHVRRRYEEFLRARSAQINDRVSHAFRKPFAKMAFQAFQDGQYDECEEYYELAVVEDPENGLLFDRYAMFLKLIGRTADALSKSTRATDLAPQDAETWFTRGILEARLAETSGALASLERARKLGKAEYLVQVQNAHAYLDGRPPNYDKARRALNASDALSPQLGDHLLSKHKAEVRRLRRRIERETAVTSTR